MAGMCVLFLTFLVGLAGAYEHENATVTRPKLANPSGADCTTLEATAVNTSEPVEGDARVPFRVLFSISDRGAAVEAGGRDHAMADTLAPELLTGPDVVGVTDKEATVLWTTDERSDSCVEYGLEPEYGLSAGSSKQLKKHRVRLTDLKVDTTYQIRVNLKGL